MLICLIFVVLLSNKSRQFHLFQVNPTSLNKFCLKVQQWFPKRGAGPSWGTQLLLQYCVVGQQDVNIFFFSCSSAKRWRSIAMNLLTGWVSTEGGAAETVWKRQLFGCRSSHRELFKVPCLHKTTHSETSSCSRGQWSTKNLPDTPRGAGCGGGGGRLLHIVYNSEYNSTTVQECRFEDFLPSGSIVSVAVALNRHIVRAWRTIMSLCSKHSDLWPSQ